MKTEKIFKTKTGFCHILSDKIILTRDGIIGNVAKVTVGNTINRVLLIYSSVYHSSSSPKESSYPAAHQLQKAATTACAWCTMYTPASKPLVSGLIEPRRRPDIEIKTGIAA